MDTKGNPELIFDVFIRSDMVDMAMRIYQDRGQKFCLFDQMNDLFCIRTRIYNSTLPRFLTKDQVTVGLQGANDNSFILHLP
jgi:hypothetical protein